MFSLEFKKNCPTLSKKSINETDGTLPQKAVTEAKPHLSLNTKNVLTETLSHWKTVWSK